MQEGHVLGERDNLLVGTCLHLIGAMGTDIVKGADLIVLAAHDQHRGLANFGFLAERRHENEGRLPFASSIPSIRLLRQPREGAEFRRAIAGFQFFLPWVPTLNDVVH